MLLCIPLGQDSDYVGHYKQGMFIQKPGVNLVKVRGPLYSVFSRDVT